MISNSVRSLSNRSVNAGYKIDSDEISMRSISFLYRIVRTSIHKQKNAPKLQKKKTFF